MRMCNVDKISHSFKLRWGTVRIATYRLLFPGDCVVDPVDEVADSRVYSWVSISATDAK